LPATIAQLERGAVSALQSTLAMERNDARMEAQLLLQHAFYVNRAWLISHAEDLAKPEITDCP